MRRQNKFLLCLSLTLAASLQPDLSVAQNSVMSRRIDGVKKAEASEIKVNQIDTSEFPRVNLYLSVTKDGTPIKDLGASDFRIREDEVDQEPITVVPQLKPLSVVVTVDTSGSMKKSMDKVKLAAKSFLDTLKSDDRVSIVSFARSVKAVSDFSGDKQSLSGNIDGLIARGDTALYDGIYKSLELLSKRDGRKAVILLSDGVDDDGRGGQLSGHPIQDVLDLAAELNVPVFTIGLGTEMDQALLQKVATTTGASYNNAPDAAQLAELYKKLGDELSGQYHLYYDSNLPGDGSLHRVSISYDGENSYKEYKSPVKESSERIAKLEEPAPKPKVVEAKSSSDSPFGKEIVGGKNFGEAVQIDSNTLYHISSNEKDTQFFYFTAPRGNHATPFLHLVSTYGKIEAFDGDREPLKLSETSYKQWDVLSIPFFVSDPEIITDDEKFYLAIHRKGPVSFGANLDSSFKDARADSDAAGEESDAVAVNLEESFDGYLGTYDNTDTYEVEIPEGKEKYSVKVRPSKNLGINVKVMNQDGYQVASEKEYKAGNAVIVSFEPKLGGSYYVSIGKQVKGDPISAYSALITKDGGTPKQPKVPKVAKIFNLRQ